jgi:hypothetical protein
VNLNQRSHHWGGTVESMYQLSVKREELNHQEEDPIDIEALAPHHWELAKFPWISMVCDHSTLWL